jgi:hypothetical protein
VTSALRWARSLSRLAACHGAQPVTARGWRGIGGVEQVAGSESFQHRPGQVSAHRRRAQPLDERGFGA